MKYILKYEIMSKYIHFIRVQQREFKYMKELRDFVLENIERIQSFQIYKLTDLSDK